MQCVSKYIASDFVLDEIRGRDFFFLIVVAPRGEIIELGECEHSVS